MVDLSVSLSAVKLKNPIIPASGTFGYGAEFWDIYDIDILGAISIKGTTLAPRLGNPTPRVAESASGMLNAVGLQNPGLESVISRELPELRAKFHQPIIANIGGFSVDEYVTCARLISREEQVGIVEVNISCPNVSHGGMSFGTDPRLAAEVTRAVKEVSAAPVFIKLSPNVTDIVEIAAACEDAGADGISLINTLLGMRFDLKRRAPLIANITGGLSGPAVFPVALRMVYDVSRAVRIPVIGMGGISCARDAIEMMMAGASAVQVGAANLVDPLACKRIIDALPDELAALGFARAADVTGCGRK